MISNLEINLQSFCNLYVLFIRLIKIHLRNLSTHYNWIVLHDKLITLRPIKNYNITILNNLIRFFFKSNNY